MLGWRNQSHITSAAWHRLGRLLCVVSALAWTGSRSASGGEPRSAASQIAPPTQFLVANWQTEDGLPQNSVTAVIQTRDGYIWLATLHGLARFDGVKFTVFNTANIPALPGDVVTTLFETEDGSLLIGTERGGVAELRDGQFKRLREPDEANNTVAGFLNSRNGGTLLVADCGRVWRLAGGQLSVVATNSEYHSIAPRSPVEDAGGTLWMVHEGGVLLRLAFGRLEEVPLEGDLAGAACRALAKDNQGELWLGTAKGLARLREGHWERQPLPRGGEPIEVSDVIASRDGGIWVESGYWHQKLRGGNWIGAPSIITDIKTWFRMLGEDRWGRLCLGCNAEGLLRISETGTPALRLDRRSGLPGNAMRRFFLDREGNEWLGLDDAGLVQLRPRCFQSLAKPDATEQAPALSVCEDHTGAVWVGTSHGGVFRFREAQVDHFVGADLPLSHIWSLLDDSRGRLWVGTGGFGLSRFEDGHFSRVLAGADHLDCVYALFEDSHGRLWLGGQGGLKVYQNDHLVSLPLPDQIADYRVDAVAEDRQGAIWAGTQGQGLLRWQNGGWTHYCATNGLASDGIWALYVDAEDVLWAGTFGGGLARLEKGRITNYSKREGLADNTISHITEDHRGYFWFGSPHGVFRVARKDLDALARGIARSLTSVNFGRGDGLPSSECTGGFQPSGWTTRDGRMLFPTLKGVAVLQPETVEDNPLPAPVIIESVVVDGHPSGNGLRPLTQLFVPPGKSRLEIQYAGLSFVAPDKVRFRYRLTGLESDWTDANARRMAQYSHLRPGAYRFEVIACNNDGVWSTTAAGLAITIQPFFWQTSSFVVSVAVVLLMSSGFAASRVEKARSRRKVESLKQMHAVERERIRIAKDIHDELGSTLTRMTLLGELVRVDKAEPQALETHADKIVRSADQAVRSLDQIVWAVNPRNDTLDSFAQYVSHYVSDFLKETEVACRLEIPSQIPAIPMSADVRHNLFLIVKEALNNVVKHSAATQVIIRITFDRRSLGIAVEDNGQGLPLAKERLTKGRSGLENMRHRAESIGATFSIQPAPTCGTCVSLTLGLHQPL